MARPWTRWPFDFISDNDGVTVLPKVSLQCGSYREDFGENIKFPAIPDEATNYRYKVHNSSSPLLFSLQCPLCLIVFTGRHCKFFDLWTLSGSASSGFRNLYDCLLQMHSGWTFFCRDLTCIVYFKRKANVRMTIYSSPSSFLHNELLSHKFETPDVNFNTQDVRLDVQLPFLRYCISWGWGNFNSNFYTWNGKTLMVIASFR